MTETEGIVERPADVIGQLEYELKRGGNSETINAMIAARDEIARLKAAEKERQSAADWINQNSMLKLFRRAQMADHFEARAERADRELAAAVAAEREECAIIASSFMVSSDSKFDGVMMKHRKGQKNLELAASGAIGMSHAARKIAAAIRARSISAP